jgi:hypothetical protein
LFWFALFAIIDEVVVEEEDKGAVGDITPEFEFVLTDCELLPFDDEDASLVTPLYRRRVCCSKNGSPQVTTSAIVQPSEKISILSRSAGSQGCTTLDPASNPSAIAVALARFTLAFVGACAWDIDKGGGDEGKEDDTGIELADEDEDEDEEDDADIDIVEGITEGTAVPDS